MADESNTASAGGHASDLGQGRSLGSEYRQAAVVMVKLAALDERVRDCYSRVHLTEQTLDELRRQLNELSLQLDARKRGALSDAQEPSTCGSIAQARDGGMVVDDLQYRRLFEKYENSVHVSRSRRRVVQSEIFSLAQRRSQLSAQISVDLLASYEALNRAGLTPAIAAVASGLCGGCKERVGPDLYDGLQAEQETLRCPFCGRFLFLPSWDRHG